MNFARQWCTNEYFNDPSFIDTMLCGFTFNAHDYSPVYRDDIATVQPPAATVNFFIKAR